MTKTSVIITVFNRSYLLRKALISLKNQSVKPDELILSDDGSKENIIADIKDIIKDYKFPVKFVSQANKGFRLAKCRNNGVRNSTGDFLIFLDQDLIHTINLIRTFILNRRERRFLTAFPTYLTEEQSEKITEEKIELENYQLILEPSQPEGIIKQYKKDKIYYYLHKLRLDNQPKLRGGACAINKEDYEAINGYDEKYKGWGNEDDDLGRRLYKFGCEGFNPCKVDFPIHLFHEPFKIGQTRVNLDYHNDRNREIKKGNYRTEFGLDKSFDDDTFEVIELN